MILMIKGFPRSVLYKGNKLTISPKCENFILVKIDVDLNDRDSASDNKYIEKAMQYVLEYCDIDIDKNSEIYIFIYSGIYYYHTVDCFKIYDISSSVSYKADLITGTYYGPIKYKHISTFKLMFKLVASHKGEEYYYSEYLRYLR